ncbi:hypothetical protein RvY_15144 [Ramazzottius varieornatus]|uniref:Uncharacterized protein n=1 Tax=Ramazzottius varieornatus TaxID=947166 RepID=A0A1D1W0U4_RAMVA|nr:hypothetical protein RvY_15144 [Ramazzottius varieornatus]
MPKNMPRSIPGRARGGRYISPCVKEYLEKRGIWDPENEEDGFINYFHEKKDEPGKLILWVNSHLLNLTKLLADQLYHAWGILTKTNKSTLEIVNLSLYLITVVTTTVLTIWHCRRLTREGSLLVILMVLLGGWAGTGLLTSNDRADDGDSKSSMKKGENFGSPSCTITTINGDTTMTCTFPPRFAAQRLNCLVV